MVRSPDDFDAHIEPREPSAIEAAEADIDLRLLAGEPQVKEVLEMLNSVPLDDPEKRLWVAMQIAKVGYVCGYTDALTDGPKGINLVFDHGGVVSESGPEGQEI